ncbi:hypothetical protein AWY96_01375 [Serratia plymuthica]|uniref:2-phosphosulfolactate phosphatase n=1 Tax=Serratia plymuthica TaxID=82996 RepID=UPI0007A0CC58|nr:2-phosphosulfolactate phosphatase [Serratia plymuthica]KYQ97221.1 hypothetical protein AWY96_01375 [Serratia plymuthica]
MYITTLNHINDSTERLNSNVVVIDQFRATSTIVTALANGVSEVIACQSFEDAEKIKSEKNLKFFFIAAEYNSKKHPLADISNSPSYLNNNKNIEKLLLATTNGTKVLNKCSIKSERLFIASILNISAVANKIQKIKGDLTFFCSGNSGKFSTEDSFCAGAIMSKLYNFRNDIIFSDNSKNAINYFKENSIESLKSSPSAIKLDSVNAFNDVEFSLKIDLYDIVPELINDTIRVL